MHTCDVTTIVPTHNSLSTLYACLSSVLQQTLPPQYLFVIDDFSDDIHAHSSLVNAAISSHISATSVRFFSLHSNHGPSVARNVGWDLATTKYIAFLDSDDAWHPQKLEIQYNLMIKDPSLVLSSHQISSALLLSQPYMHGHTHYKNISFTSMLFSNRILTSSVMLRRCYNNKFRFSPLKRYSEDYTLWLQISRQSANLVSIQLPLAYRLISPSNHSGLSSNLLRMHFATQLNLMNQINGLNLNLLFVFMALIFELTKFFFRLLKSLRYKLKSILGL